MNHSRCFFACSTVVIRDVHVVVMMDVKMKDEVATREVEWSAIHGHSTSRAVHSSSYSLTIQASNNHCTRKNVRDLNPSQIASLTLPDPSLRCLEQWINNVLQVKGMWVALSMGLIRISFEKYRCRDFLEVQLSQTRSPLLPASMDIMSMSVASSKELPLTSSAGPYSLTPHAINASHFGGVRCLQTP